MIVQIYSIQSIEEANACIDAGVDYLGLAIDNGHNLPAQLSLQEAKNIFDAIGDRAKKVVIIVGNDEAQIIEYCKYLKPDVLQLCDYDFYGTKQFNDKLRNEVPGVEISQAIPVGTDFSIVEVAKKYAQISDYLILDSVLPTINGVGASGLTHDWNIDKKIVEEVNTRVIIAGGLGSDNIEEAIKKINPWGVDSFTKTSDINPDKTSKKNIDKVKQFVLKAKNI